MTLGSAVEWRKGLDAGDLSSEALVKLSLDRMTQWDGSLHAVLAREDDRSLALARQADARLRAGERTPVLGLPVLLKDNLHWSGVQVSCGSRMNEAYRAPYDATVVKRLLAAGAVPIAKTNLDEFAMGSSGEYSAFGPTHNPWDRDRVPGGSSSGSVVGVAAGYAPLALGSDTGGSVRLPASFCNVTALRPTYGVLSRYGLTAMASSLDQVGPIGTSAADIALLLDVMAGLDPLDSTSSDLRAQVLLNPLKPEPLKGLRVGLPKEYFQEALEPAVRALLEKALGTLRDQGAQLIEVQLPHSRWAIDTYYLLCTSEVSSNLSRFDGIRFGHRSDQPSFKDRVAQSRDEGFGAEVKRRILLGTFCLSKGSYEAFYLKAQRARTLIQQDFQRAFQCVDVLATPVSPGPAFPAGSRLQDPLSMYLADLFTVPSSLAALPCLAMPAGLSEGLPVGIQLIGPSQSDVRLLSIAHAFQQVTSHHLKRPPLVA
jgi:aspartyl-tRNA(Asn)/glutamyl-tRNA(Gln) amidotransferase subunit A